MYTYYVFLNFAKMANKGLSIYLSIYLSISLSLSLSQRGAFEDGGSSRIKIQGTAYSGSTESRHRSGKRHG